MTKEEILKIVQESGLFKAHPWHGIEIYNDKSNDVISAYVEIVPENRIKYELDKKTGFLKVDRPQKFSNIIPALYGFIPQTYSKEASAKVAEQNLGRENLVGDEDPIDICILTDKSIKHGDFILEAIPVGGFRMIDHGEVDDKIIAVLKGDSTYGHIRDLEDIPSGVVESLKHYFLTYKEIPVKNGDSKVEIPETYGREKALEVIEAGDVDYKKYFSGSNRN